jgi:SNF family Na+-dependent transporter
VILFMITLYLLGIDSCLSMLDAAKMGVMDFKWGQRLFGGSYELCNTALAILGIIIAIPCNFKYGLILWDRWDFYLNNWGLLVIAFLEVLAVSFFYKREDRSEAIGETSCNVIDIGLISGMIISAFVFVYVDFSSMYVRVAV